MNRRRNTTRPLNNIESNYIIGDALGEGTFSTVKLSEHKVTGEKVAIKILEKKRIKNDEDFQRMVREIRILRRIRHPTMIQLYEIHETDDNLYFVMEYINGGELYDYIVKKGRLNEEEACHLFYQLILAIEHLDSLGISHRDIKPENILLDKNRNLKLIDFGLGRLYEKNENLETACGSPCYAAPEMVARKVYRGTDVDIWSAGVTLFAMLCGHLPFDDNDLSSLYAKILKGEYTIKSNLSLDARDLISKILVTDPKKRYDLNMIKNHPWMKIRFLHKMQTPLNLDVLTVSQPILDKMVSSGLNEDLIVQGIEQNHHNMLTTIYYLLKAKKLSKEHLDNFELKLTDIKRIERDISKSINPRKSSQNQIKNNLREISSKIRESKTGNLKIETQKLAREENPHRKQMVEIPEANSTSRVFDGGLSSVPGKKKHALTTRESYNMQNRKVSKVQPRKPKNNIIETFKKRIDSMMTPLITDRPSTKKDSRSNIEIEKQQTSQAKRNIQKIFAKRQEKMAGEEQESSRKSVLTKLLSPKRSSKVMTYKISYRNQNDSKSSKTKEVSYISSKKGKISTRIRTENDSISITVEHTEREKILTPQRRQENIFLRNRQSQRIQVLAKSKNSVSQKKQESGHWTDNMKKILMGRLGSQKMFIKKEIPKKDTTPGSSENVLFKSMDFPGSQPKTTTSIKVQNLFSLKKTSPLAGMASRKQRTNTKASLTHRNDVKNYSKNSSNISSFIREKNFFRSNANGNEKNQSIGNGPVAIDFLFDADTDEFRETVSDKLETELDIQTKQSKRTIMCTSHGQRFYFDLPKVEVFPGTFSCATGYPDLRDNENLAKDCLRAEKIICDQIFVIQIQFNLQNKNAQRNSDNTGRLMRKSNRICILGSSPQGTRQTSTLGNLR